MVIYPWQQTKHGQECFDNFGSTDSSRPLPLPSFIHFPLPAELLPMLTVAATFLGYTTNNTNRKQKQKQQKQNKKQQQKAHRKWWGEKKQTKTKQKTSSLKFIYLNAEDPVFETACKKWIPT